ncbi:ScyD/ScyE family protein [Nocardioides aestuarii]|uniref:ScyD/ScyE family protein n=1 Tax=Nocardioides aestuarii TaxID=252231 RepID=A0ABW4TQR7_9ACTN
MRLNKRSTPLAVAATAIALIGSTIAPAQAGVEPEVVAGGLVTPLSVAVAGDGDIYVSQNFAGLLTRVPSGGGDPVVVFAHPDGAEVGAVSATADGAVFATTGGTRRRPNAHLWSLAEGAEGPTKLANLYRYEKRVNPDAGNTYGLVARRGCLKQVPPFVRPYQGIIEAHPYATARGEGVTYVADAAGNSVLAVPDGGGTRTIGILPPTRVEITRAIKREFGLPKCVIGKTYRAEGVPTDVETGPDGALYVTSLPGAPGEGLPTGRIYRFDPEDGSRTVYGRGLVSPTGLAMTPDGTAYVAQLFAGSIVQIPVDGATTEFAQVPFVGDVEVADGSLYATDTDLGSDGSGPPAGKVLRWTLAP